MLCVVVVTAAPPPPRACRGPRHRRRGPRVHLGLLIRHSNLCAILFHLQVPGEQNVLDPGQPSSRGWLTSPLPPPCLHRGTRVRAKPPGGPKVTAPAGPSASGVHALGDSEKGCLGACLKMSVSFTKSCTQRTHRHCDTITGRLMTHGSSLYLPQRGSETPSDVQRELQTPAWEPTPDGTEVSSALQHCCVQGP